MPQNTSVDTEAMSNAISKQIDMQLYSYGHNIQTVNCEARDDNGIRVKYRIQLATRPQIAVATPQCPQ